MPSNHSWMSSIRLSLNSAKTQLIWLGTPQQLLKLDHALLFDRFSHFAFHTTVRDLCVTLDSTLGLFAAHFQFNSLLLLPTEASKNHSQSCIYFCFHLHCTCICLLKD